MKAGLNRLSSRRRIGGLFVAWILVLGACTGAGETTTTGEGATTTTTGPEATSVDSTVETTAPADPVKIGVLAPTSGVFAVIGVDLIDGFQLFVDQNDGTLGGCPVELIVENTEGDPETGRRVAEKLIREDEIDLATGVLSSAVALSVRDVFHDAEVPIVMSNPSANAITREARSPYIFRTTATSYMFGASIAQWAFDNVAQDRVVVSAADYAAGQEITAGFQQAFEELGGEVIGSVLPPLGTTEDYQPFLAQIRELEPNAVFAFFPGGDAIGFVNQYSEFGLAEDVPLIGSGFLVDESILPAQGEAALGIRTSLHYSPQLENEVNAEFRAAFEEAYDRLPIAQSFQAYMAAMLVDHGLREVACDVENVDALVQAMETVGSLESPGGVFEMDPESHTPALSFHVREVQELDGSLVNVPIEDVGVFEDPGE